MRGKPGLNAHNSASIRITPADAGKTYYNSESFASNPDHPRGCGENQQASYLYSL